MTPQDCQVCEGHGEIILAGNRVPCGRCEAVKEAFERGARAMRNACAEVVREWWGKAPAGRRHPGHPHHLEVSIRAVKVEHLEERE